MRPILLAAAGLAAVVAVALPAGANNSWNGYHWARTSNPFTPKVIDSMTPGWDGYLDVAESDWAQSSVLDLAEEAGSDSAADRQSCHPAAGKIRACNYAFGKNGWLGRAQIWLLGSHITQGTAKVNDSYFDTPTYNNANAKQHVICQEVAHTFGLDHQRSKRAKSCMNDFFGLFDPAYAHPNQHDFDQLVSIYSHLDSSSTVAALAAAAAPRGDLRVERVERPDESIVVEYLAGGVKRVTFIFWAPSGSR